MSAKKRLLERMDLTKKTDSSQNDSIRIAVETNANAKMVMISAPPSHLLTVSKVESAPKILWKENGLINSLTPEDEIELERQLEKDAVQSADWEEGQKVAVQGFENFTRGLFQMQRYTVTFNYFGPTGSDLQKVANNDRPAAK